MTVDPDDPDFHEKAVQAAVAWAKDSSPSPDIREQRKSGFMAGALGKHDDTAAFDWAEIRMYKIAYQAGERWAKEA